ncbi:MAG: fatty acid oxidation complex subunit alpha FadB [Pseudomonadota bacterium]|nr:fatty acid oxidation complex subunit alpha FadB [Pseudomonadota bacterium]
MFEGKTLTLSKNSNGIAEMCFSSQYSVNKLDIATIEEIKQAVDLLETDSSVRGLLMSSGKSAFIVGADITEFTELFNGPEQALYDGVQQVHRLFNRLEDLPFPKVAAINGFALGGGFELALTAEFRVCADVAALGFPEVKLGIIPGYGGTVRAPRVMGCDNAVEWICTGKHAKATEGLALGAVDAVVPLEGLEKAALSMLQAAINGELDYASRRAEKKAPVLLNDMERLMAFTSAGGLVSAQAGRNYPAPMSALKAIEKHASLGREEASKVEIEHFVSLAFTDVARSLVGLFLNEQEVSKKARALAGSVEPVESAGVLGAGIMGGGIAYQSAAKGVPILMKDIAQSGLDAGMKEASSLFSKRVNRGRMKPEKMAEALTQIKPSLDYSGIENADVVVEAVVENLKIKKAVLAECEALMANDAVLCSNTSTIQISELAEPLIRPENFCGMHFFNPVHKMPLVEVIRGKQSSDTAVAKTMSYALSLGKTPILVNDCAGFLVNRVLFPYLGSANALMKEGVDFVEIDRVMERWGWPMGPAYLQDVVGLDTCQHASGVMAEAFPERMQVDYKSAAEALFEAGRLGQKNAKGFYQYVADKKGRIQKTADDAVAGLLSSYTDAAKTMEQEEIIDRLMVPMALEMIRCLDERIVATPAEADMALIMGIGFPMFRGGICRWLDNTGIREFCAKAEKYAGLGEPYRLLDSIKSMAAEGKTFY